MRLIFLREGVSQQHWGLSYTYRTTVTIVATVRQEHFFVYMYSEVKKYMKQNVLFKYFPYIKCISYFLGSTERKCVYFEYKMVAC